MVKKVNSLKKVNSFFTFVVLVHGYNMRFHCMFTLFRICSRLNIEKNGGDYIMRIVYASRVQTQLAAFLVPYVGAIK